jgi:hypothetical protein
MENIVFMCIVRSNVQKINYLALQYFDFDRISLPECYSRNASCAVNYISSYMYEYNVAYLSLATKEVVKRKCINQYFFLFITCM